MRNGTKSVFAVAVAAAVACSGLAARGGVPVAWTADAWRARETALTAYHGETLDLAATLTAYGRPLDLAGKTARLWWTTNVTDRGTAATGAAWFVTNATVKADSATGATNVLAATWYGASDTGADRVAGFIGVEGEIYRAAFTLTLRAAPGFSPAELSLPTRVLDFAVTEVANPTNSPFALKGEGGGGSASKLLDGQTFATPTSGRERKNLLLFLIRALGGNVEDSGITPGTSITQITIKASDGTTKVLKVVKSGDEYTTEVE